MPTAGPVSVKRSLIAKETASGEKTVLVVDDDEGVLTTATEIVSDLGYHVLSAKNGQQALQILKGGYQGRSSVLGHRHARRHQRRSARTRGPAPETQAQGLADIG